MNRRSRRWVLLRGLAREQAHWGDFPAVLAAAVNAADVITLDLPGAGLLRHQRSPLNVDAIVDACRVQLRELGVDGPVNLLGLSLGGMVAAQWLHRRPQDVAAAVIVNSSARGLGAFRQRLRPSSWPTLLRIGVQWGRRAAQAQVLRLTSAQPQRHLDVIDPWTRVQTERPVSRRNAVRQLLAAARYRLPTEAPHCRVLVACSARDGLVDPQCSRVLAATWGCDIVTHEHAGHDLPLDDAVWLAHRIADWAGC